MAEFNQRKSVNDNLYKYDILAKEDSYIEITEWTNGEGWDITIDNELISLTYGKLEAINHLINLLQYNK